MEANIKQKLKNIEADEILKWKAKEADDGI